MTNELDTNWSLYPYSPDKPAPIIFAVLLVGLGLYHAYLSFWKYKWTRFGFTMCIASSVWAAGFLCRSISVYKQQNIGIFVAQDVLVLLGTPLYAAAEYFILGRLLAYLPYHTPIHPNRVFSTYAILSAVVESLTATGAANSANPNGDSSARTTGMICLKVALLIQCFIEASFFSLVMFVEYRCHKSGKFPRQLRPVFAVLYTTSFMILVRCIVRTIEGFESSACNKNNTGVLKQCATITTHEWFLWVFEVANITLVVILLAIFHPGKYLPRSGKIFLDPIDGRTERLGPGFSKADKRAKWRTIVDPFNLSSDRGLTLDRFWERDQPVYSGRELASIKHNTKNYQHMDPA